jgi:hypothetical protein
MSEQTVASDGICLFRRLSVLLEHEGQCDRLMEKAAQHTNGCYFLGILQTGGSGKFDKLTEKSTFSSIVQTVTGGVNYNFSGAEQRERK